jgi:hypothetical protein
MSQHYMLRLLAPQLNELLYNVFQLRTEAMHRSSRALVVGDWCVTGNPSHH